MDDVVSVTNLSKTYTNNKKIIRALDSIAFSIHKGEVFGLLGPNGAGKTTLISILCGIITPDQGSAVILGLDCSKDHSKLQPKMNFVSGFTGVLSSLSAYEALKYYSYLYSVKNAEKKIEEVFALTALAESKNISVEEFSAGMKQRFLIAKSLLNDPQVLILDEPTVGLDVESAIVIRDLIKKFKKEGRTVLLTTHNMFEAQELCDRIAFIKGGKIIMLGTFAELQKKIKSKNSIEINCTNPEAVVSALSSLSRISVKIIGKQLLEVVVEDYSVMNKILEKLSKSTSEIFSVNVLEPTLEEAYLEIITKKSGASNA